MSRPALIAVVALSAALCFSSTGCAKPPVYTAAQLVERTSKSLVVVRFSGRDGRQQGLGAGFVVSADGLIATNLHVIGEARPVSVELADGRKFPVEAVHASDRRLDLALLRIRADNLPPALKLGDSNSLKQGTRVVAMGNPLGLQNSVVSGIVSGHREIEGRKMIQLAIPVEQGNSGGPVLDMHGNVQGLVTMKSLVTRNLGFAVAINDLKPLIAKPNPVPMTQWLTIGALDHRRWKQVMGGHWRRQQGQITVNGQGSGFGGRTLCIYQEKMPATPYEVTVQVKLDNERGAGGLVFDSDDGQRHYGFYPSNGNMRLTQFNGAGVLSWSVLHNKPAANYRTGDYNTLKVRIEPKRVLCYLNDRLIVEHQDNFQAPGKPGLVAFRGTQPKFKKFHAGKTLPGRSVSPQVLAKVAAQIDKLPSLDHLRDSDLQAIAENSDASRQSLRNRAREMERRARELRLVAARLHVQKVAGQLAALARQGDKLDLVHGALLVAQLDDEDLEIKPYLQQVDTMSRDLKAVVNPQQTNRQQLESVNKFLFQQRGFHGGRTNYYHRDNSYINRVLEDREGLPVTLAVLYIELCRRVGLHVQGVGVPGHFMVKFAAAAAGGTVQPPEPEGKPEEYLIDVFNRGDFVSRKQAATLAGIKGELTSEMLKAASHPSILVRMLRNLYGIAEAKEDKQAMLGYVEAMLAIEPHVVQHRGVRAVLLHATGQHDAAMADLNWFLEKKPDGIDLDRIREMKNYFQQK